MSAGAKQKILIIYAHPDSDGSVANKAMIEAARQIENVTIVDLYAQYPDSIIDIQAENEQLKNTDILIFQFPLYWYSSPALLKQWQDEVLVHGLTYGKNTTILNGKSFLCAVTAGVDEGEFSDIGSAGHSLPTILCPFEQTFSFCKMHILPPFLWYEAPEQMAAHVSQYTNLLISLRDRKYDPPSSHISQEAST